MSVDLRAEIQARIGASLPLSIDALDRLERYFELLKRWNTRINLTSLDLEPLTPEAIERLLVEPLMAVRYVQSPRAWMDLGSGGGSPAIPMKIARPELKLTMIESRSRKASFLREAARELALGDVTVICERFHATASSSVHEQSADLVTLRAVRFDDETASACRALLTKGGQLFAFGRASETDVPIAPSGFEFVFAAPLDSRATLSVFRRE